MDYLSKGVEIVLQEKAEANVYPYKSKVLPTDGEFVSRMMQKWWLLSKCPFAWLFLGTNPDRSYH